MSLDAPVKLPRVQVVRGRMGYLMARAEGKRVLHVGCVGAGYLEERFEQGKVLHQRLAPLAAELWGVDIDREGVEFLRSQGFENILVGDAMKIGEIEELRKRRFEVIIASELVEHLSNPGLFFEGVKKIMTPGGTDLIITVPNAFSLIVLSSLLRGREWVHPDHNFYFSYRTITGFIEKQGFEVKEVLTYSYRSGARVDPEAARLPARGSALRRAWRWMRKLPQATLRGLFFLTTPFWADGLIVVAGLAEPQASAADAARQESL